MWHHPLDVLGKFPASATSPTWLCSVDHLPLPPTAWVGQLAPEDPPEGDKLSNQPWTDLQYTCAELSFYIESNPRQRFVTGLSRNVPDLAAPPATRYPQPVPDSRAT